MVWRGRAGASHHRQGGSYEAWRNEVAAPMAGNPLGVFALSAAFAAPLLRKTGGEGGGFHIRGASSTGKTTLLIAAGSVCGGGGPLGYSQSWRNTDNALEAVALAHNDGLLALDELRALAPEAAGLAAYTLAAGVSKGRMRAEGELRPRPTWRVMILSTGEISLADMVRLSKTKERAYAGQELRLLDLQANQGQGLGCWRELHGAPGAAAFSEQIRAAASTHYGHALPLFVERILERETELLTAHAEVKAAFLAEALRARDHGQIRRAAHRFADVAAAGELASLLDVVPWPRHEAAQSVLAIFNEWADAFGRALPREDRDVIRTVRRFLEQNAGSAFRRVRGDDDLDDGLATNRAGEARALKEYGHVLEHASAGWLYCFGTESFREILQGFDAEQAACVLQKLGFLFTTEGARGLQYKFRLPGIGFRSGYAVKASILEGNDDPDTA